MPQVTYVEPEGRERRVEVPAGRSLMHGAIDHNVSGIDADCGGGCACATCHVHVDEGWLEKVGQPGEEEASVLTYAPDVQPNSRLACQIPMTPALDGLVVRVVGSR